MIGKYLTRFIKNKKTMDLAVRPIILAYLRERVGKVIYYNDLCDHVEVHNTGKPMYFLKSTRTLVEELKDNKILTKQGCKSYEKYYVESEILELKL